MVMSGFCGVLLKSSNGHDRIGLGGQTIAQVLKNAGSGWGEHLLHQSGRLSLMGWRMVSDTQREISDVLVHENKYVLAFMGKIFDGSYQHSTCLENILNAYERVGLRFIDDLRGEYVLALWDIQSDSLHLFTDRFRTYSLLYYEDDKQLVFSTTMRLFQGLLSPCALRVNPEAIVDVISNSIIATPKTIFSQIRKVPPGYRYSDLAGTTEFVPYWDLDYRTNGTESAETLRGLLQDTLRESVKIRLHGLSNLNQVGAFLSGGVDSSTIVGLLHEITGAPVNCFSIGFGEDRFNEIDYARIAAEAFHSKLYEYFVTPADMGNCLESLLQQFDEPYANSSAVPTYFCSKLARENGTEVLFAGDGGDELFGGNERYAIQRLFDYYYYCPEWLRERVLAPLILNGAEHLGWKILDSGRKYIKRAKIPYPDRLVSYGFLSSFPLQEIFQDDFLGTVGMHYDPNAPLKGYYTQAPADNELDRQLYLDLKLTIGDNDLIKVAKMTRAAGISVRFPFLDHQLAEFSTKIPAAMKMRGLKLRSFFKKTYQDLLPKQILSKTKHGFGLPVPVWLRTDKYLNEVMHDLLLSPQTVQRGYFKQAALQKLIDLHSRDETSYYGSVIWNFMALEIWHRASWNK